jgi:hypothetical protein
MGSGPNPEMESAVEESVFEELSDEQEAEKAAAKK